MMDVEALVKPVIEAAGFELVEVTFGRESGSRVLRITVDRPGEALDLDAIAEAAEKVSRRLDLEGFAPGPYRLEVSSPGIERPLRTPAHFAKAAGATVSVKTRPQVPGERRMQGTLVTSDDDGFILDVDGSDEPVRLAYSDIDRARTVFVWGGLDTPGNPASKKSGQGKSAVNVATQKDQNGPTQKNSAPTQKQKRKQVVTP